MLRLSRRAASSFLTLVTRKLTDAKIDARTFSHAQARAKQCIKDWSATFGGIVNAFDSSLKE